jgi:hydrogenase maturation protease
LRPETQLLDGATDLLAYVDRFAAFDLVVLVDAILGPAPRELLILPEDAFDAWPVHATSAHQVSPLVTLRLFRTLEPRSKTRFVLVGLRVPEEAFSADVSVADAQAGAEAVLRALSGEFPEPSAPAHLPWPAVPRDEASGCRRLPGLLRLVLWRPGRGRRSGFGGLFCRFGRRCGPRTGGFRVVFVEATVFVLAT